MATPIGAKVVAGGRGVRRNQNKKISFQNVRWDSGNFFRASQSNRLRIPSGRGGRYIVQLAIRWYWLDDTAPPVDPTSSYFYAAVLVNNQTRGGDSRSTVPRAPHAQSTTQLIVYEADLAGGDRLQAQVWHGFNEDLWADVYFQARRLGDSA
jgi:hypothetical protein